MENLREHLVQMYFNCLSLIVTEHEESVRKIQSFTRKRFLLNNIVTSVGNQDDVYYFYTQQVQGNYNIYFIDLTCTFNSFNTFIINYYVCV